MPISEVLIPDLGPQGADLMAECEDEVKLSEIVAGPLSGCWPLAKSDVCPSSYSQSYCVFCDRRNLHLTSFRFSQLRREVARFRTPNSSM
jgi:hypothetical protein